MLRLDAATVTASRLCMASSECARSKSLCPDRMLHCWAMACPLELDRHQYSQRLSFAFVLREIFRSDGRRRRKSTPVLHAHAARETDPMAPFSSAYNVFRTAAAVMFANKERNLALTQRLSFGIGDRRLRKFTTCQRELRSMRWRWQLHSGRQRRLSP